MPGKGEQLVSTGGHPGTGFPASCSSIKRENGAYVAVEEPPLRNGVSEKTNHGLKVERGSALNAVLPPRAGRGGRAETRRPA
jgi:hypothetical protein